MTTEQKKTPNFKDAVAKDWYSGIQNDLSQMSPGQLAVAQRALADFVAKKADTSAGDMERKIARMSEHELQELVRDGDDAKRRANNR